MIRAFDPRRFAELDALLQQALDLEGDARATFLHRLDAEQPTLAPHLRTMLDAAEEDAALGDLLDQRLWAALADDAACGQEFGAWRARGTLAHGGMARVLLAERADGGFEQRAAIKCLWPGLATRELIARFEQERQILARLDDPRIARLLDGGVRGDGMPWLALEYVAGKPIGEHCDDTRLDLDVRLALWDDVAAAVASAHRNLVVHRDLKPGNVLVRDDGAVKLLDFGIAKLLDPAGFPHAAPVTEIDSRALTRDYASPEQLRGETVTTASDVYQLGLLVYELATGVQPFRGKGASAASRERAILEDDPPLASSQFARGTEADARAAQRSASATSLSRRLRGDFDAIVRRALAKSPDERYATVDAMREDIAHWRTGLPVRARRASVAVRTGKWLLRHRMLAAGGTLIAAIAIAYTTTALLQARALAREAEINRSVRDYLVGWFQAADPGSNGGRDPKASEMLVDGLARARRELSARPEIKAEIVSIVGEIYMARGDYASAEPVLREAHDLYNALPAVDREHRGSSTHSLATLMHYRGRYVEAESLFREALQQRIDAIGERGYWTLVTRQYYADLLHSRGRYDEAIDEFARAYAGAEATLGREAPLTAHLERNLADVYRDRGRQSEAERLYRHALAAMQAAHGEMHPNTISTRMALGRLMLEQGRTDEATAEIEPSYQKMKQLFGDTPATSYWERVVAELEEARGDLDASRARLDHVREVMHGQLPEAHIIFGYVALDAGYVELARGHLKEAEAEFATGERIFDAIQPEGHPRRIETQLGRALIARRNGNAADSAALLANAQQQARRQLSATHPLMSALDAAGGSSLASTQEPSGLAMLRVQRALADDRASQAGAGTMAR